MNAVGIDVSKGKSMVAALLNKRQFSLWYPSTQQRRENLQKGALNLTEIQHEDRHGNHMGSGFLQLGSNQTHATFPFRQAKPALYFHAFTFIQVILRLVLNLTLSRSAQSRAGEADSVFLAITEILTVSVDLIRQNTAGIMPFTLPEPFYHLL